MGLPKEGSGKRKGRGSKTTGVQKLPQRGGPLLTSGKAYSITRNNKSHQELILAE